MIECGALPLAFTILQVATAKVAFVVVTDEVMRVASNANADGLLDEAAWFEDVSTFMICKQLLRLQNLKALLLLNGDYYQKLV